MVSGNQPLDDEVPRDTETRTDVHNLVFPYRFPYTLLPVKGSQSLRAWTLRSQFPDVSDTGVEAWVRVDRDLSRSQ